MKSKSGQSLTLSIGSPAASPAGNGKLPDWRRLGVGVAAVLLLIAGDMNVGLLKAQEPSASANVSLASLKKLPHLESELLVVTDTQSSPSVMNRTAGPFILQVVNRTFNSDLAIVIEPAAGSRSAGPSASSARLAARLLGRQAARLSGEPGEYDIKAADTGRILCHLVIGEKQ